MRLTDYFASIEDAHTAAIEGIAGVAAAATEAVANINADKAGKVTTDSSNSVTINVPTADEVCKAVNFGWPFNHAPRAQPVMRSIPDIEKVIFNEECGVTVVLWADDTRTVVRLGKGESFDRYAGFSAAVMKRLFGGTSTAKKVLDSRDEAIIKQKIQQAKEEEQRKLDEKAAVFRQRAQKRKEKRYAELVQYFVDESKAKADADVILKAEAADKSQFIANLSSQIAKEIVENLEKNGGD